MKIYFATSNKGKVGSISQALSQYKIKVIHVSLDLPEPRSDDLREIAEAKVLYAYRKIKKPCLVLDSGFYIKSLNGFPRTFVNFALETIGIEGILKLAEGQNRECEFRNCLAYLDKKLKEPVFFEFKVRGRLALSRQGKSGKHHWSELFFIFIPNGQNKTLAEMPFAEYQKWRVQLFKKLFATNFAKWFFERRAD